MVFLAQRPDHFRSPRIEPKQQIHGVARREEEQREDKEREEYQERNGDNQPPRDEENQCTAAYLKPVLSTVLGLVRGTAMSAAAPLGSHHLALVGASVGRLYL
jgi:hypothetical protein